MLLSSIFSIALPIQSNFIFNILADLVWWIFVKYELVLIDALTKENGVIDYLVSGAVFSIIFQNNDFNSGNITDIFPNMPRIFIVFAILGAATIVLMFIIQMIIIQFATNATTREKFIKAIKNSFLAGFVIVFLPAFLGLLNFLITGLLKYMRLGFQQDTDYSLANIIYRVGYGTDGSSQIVPPDFSGPASWDDYNIFLEIATVWFSLISIGLGCITLVERVIDIFLLIAVSPLVAAMMPVDDGKRLMSWKDLIIGKYLSGPIILLPIYIYVTVMSTLETTIHATTGANFPWLYTQIIIALFAMGGALTCTKVQKILLHLITSNIGLQSALDSNPYNSFSTLRNSVSTIGGLFSSGLNVGKSALSTGSRIAFGKTERNEQGEVVKQKYGAVQGLFAAAGFARYLSSGSGGLAASRLASGAANVYGSGYGLAKRSIKENITNPFQSWNPDSVINERNNQDANSSVINEQNNQDANNSNNDSNN